ATGDGGSEGGDATRACVILPDAASSPRWETFFFQAEDGIRDFHVTGVQTCALPICRRTCLFGHCTRGCASGPSRSPRRSACLSRSEERPCRERGSMCSRAPPWTTVRSGTEAARAATAHAHA